MTKLRRFLDDGIKGERRRKVWTGLAVALLTFAVFLPAYAYDFDRHEGWVWDDDDHYLRDHLIRADDGWWRIWLDPQPGIVGEPGAAVVWNYWPLTRTSFWIERRLWGADAHGNPRLLGSHLVNVGLHALNAVLWIGVLRQLRVPGAAWAGLLFAVHPVTVESVAWITQRKALLSTLFFLAALAGWLRFTQTGRPRWYLFTSGSFLLALMAKTTTVMFPVVLVLIHAYQGRAWTRRAVLRLGPFFAMSLIAGITSIVFESYIGSTGEAWSATIAERIAAAGMIAWWYLGKLILPLGLAFNYPRWQIDASALSSYLPSAAALALAAILWRFRRSWARPWALALGAFLVNLFPVLGFFNVYGMRYAQVADHWQYLACLPIFALAGGLLATAPERVARVGPALAGAARVAVGALGVLGLASCSWLTWHHSAAYVDRATLWRHTLEQEPDSLIAHNNLGSQLLGERRYTEAIAHFHRAIEIDPSLPEPYVNLGNALDASGRRAEAASRWEQALERDPRHPIALDNLAARRMNQGRFEDAESLLRRALEAKPGFASALGRLARLYQRQGRPDAIRPFVARAQQPAASAAGSRGKRIAIGIWSAMGVALAACGLVAAGETGSPAPAVRARAREKTV
jgi:tetratricopeptide (TPR) repeat protein